MKVSLSQYVAILRRYLQNQKLRFAWLSLLVFTSIGLQIVNPQIMQRFIDAATGTDADASYLVLTGLTFLGVAFLAQVLSVGATYMGESVAWRATNTLREDLAAHCLDLDMSFHAEKSPGEFVERIETDATEFATFFSQLIIRVIGNLLLLAGILLALTLVNVRLGIAFALFATVTLMALNRVRGIAIPYQKAHRDAETAVFGFLEERLAGTEDIRSCGAVGYVLNKLYSLHTEVLRRRWQANLAQLGIGATGGLLMIVGFAVAFLMGHQLYSEGFITIGVVYLVVHYTNLIARPIRELTQQVESLQNIGATVERMGELLGQKAHVTDGPGVNFGTGSLALEFHDVHFAYAENKPVLRGITFQLQPGKVLGLLGRTGGGKTTIARLVFRLYDPTNGAVRINGSDLRLARLQQLRGRVAYVTQDVQLFQASVRDNITLFDKSVSDERILNVIDALGLHSWYANLPEGLDTRLQSGGRSLSAGEAQLLALTRVFLRDPGLVVLDEASSRLDPATEQLVEQAIDRLLAGRTAIIIAHRLATVHRSDDVLIIDEGQVAEYGNRRQLLADPTSRFHHLHQTGLEEMLA